MTCFAISSKSEPVTVSVKTQQAGATISPLMLGLSFETGIMLPDTNSVRYFRPSNKPLVNLFRTLGIKSLRIGGNSVDATNFAIPSDADVRSLFDFAKAAGVKVIYSVRLQNGNPQSAAAIAKLISQDYSDVLDCFAIGNEPGYYKEYAVYTNKWIAIRDAMLKVFPAATFCGPDQNPSPELCERMVRDFGGAKGSLVKITTHSYPFGCSYKNFKEKDPAKLIQQDAATSREKMLQPDAYPIYEKILNGLTNAVTGTGVAFRMSEVNSYWFSGLQGASDRFASALWGADYLHWWAAQGADGLNFHTGDRTGGSIVLPCRYAAFVSSGKGYEARPLAYGLKLFDLGGHGKTLPVTVKSAKSGNIAAYAVLSEEKAVCVTLINKSNGSNARNEDIEIKLDRALTDEKAEIIFLQSIHGDLADESAAVRLGGSAIKQNGTWRGTWKKLPHSAINGGMLRVTLPAASAAVVKII